MSIPNGVRTLPSIPTKARICVVGGGVIGLTSALRILQARKNSAGSYGGVTGALTVVADRFGRETTTNGAAGVWGPYKLSSTPDELVHAWGAETHAHLMKLIYSKDAAHAGCSLARVNILAEAPEAFPFWSDIPFDFQRMRKDQLTYFPERFVDGYSYTTVTCEGAFYQAWLSQQITDLGGVFVQSKLACLQDAAALGDFDAIVDCCGLGSHQLCDDKESYPIRGQLTRVRAPWITQGLFGGSSYIIPNRNCVVLGGTGQIGNWNTEVSLEDKEAIWEGCCELLPSLRDAEHIEDWVDCKYFPRKTMQNPAPHYDPHTPHLLAVHEGLRPGRTSLRLELESLRSGDRGAVIPIIHNYGHGGAGLTLGWGCAGNVVKLLAGVL